MSKIEADELKRIEIHFLKKKGFLRGFNSGTLTWSLGGEPTASAGVEVSVFDDEKYLRLFYTQTKKDSGEKQNFDYKVQLVSTACYFGKSRYWFICPFEKEGVYCGKRVGTLYKHDGYFVCRHCLDLTYKSRNRNRRSSIYPATAILDIREKIDTLEENAKRQTWRGIPTKKQQRIERMYGRSVETYRQFLHKEKRKER